jgi:Domain of unknown function (DUF4174)
MRLCSAILAVALAVTPAGAQETLPVAAVPEPEASQPTLEELLWVARPLVIFADTPDDPRFVQQLALLEERLPELEERDVVILTDTDPGASGPLRQELRPRGFGVVLIDKDGIVAQRHPTPVTARELINLIDRMPSRRQETGSRRQ